MLVAVLEDVDQGVAHFGGGAEDSAVVAVSEDGAPARPQSVEGTGDSDGQPLHGSGQGFAAARLDDQVQVIALN